jgi:hypothetical protein
MSLGLSVAHALFTLSQPDLSEWVNEEPLLVEEPRLARLFDARPPGGLMRFSDEQHPTCNQAPTFKCGCLTLRGLLPSYQESRRTARSK